MAKNNIIEVVCFGKEIGRLGFDENRNRSFYLLVFGKKKQRIWGFLIRL